MKLIYHPSSMLHDTGMHPENKKRLESLGDLPVSEIAYDESLISLVHDKKYVAYVKSCAGSGRALDGDTHTSAGSFEAAVYAANATLLASQQGDFAVVRPPGHHAYPGHASGFCLFNNVAIATKYWVDQGKKVLIFDFDGHLGDGTSRIFYESNQVMYWSIHQFPAFPGHGSEQEIGNAEGLGFTINVPVPPGSGDDIFMDGIKSTLPVALQFEPDIVAVSAGFDAHQYDLLLDLRTTVDIYYEIGKLLVTHFNNIFATLEGGYNIEILPKCIANFLAGINEESKPYSEAHTESNIKVMNDYELRINNVLVNLKSYWNI